ncbi:MAG TPA: hypothetical protein VGE62_01865 [Candidatus Paceibacterota bacterium]
MKRKPNPLKGTVSRFLSSGSQKWSRHKKKCERLGLNPEDVPVNTGCKRRSRAKKPRESDFVRFMNSIQTRGPDRPGTVYERWTKSIRATLETEGVWPTGTDDWNLDVVARYFQELQKELRASAMKVRHAKDRCKRRPDAPIHWIIHLLLDGSYRKKKAASLRESADEVHSLRRSFGAIYKDIRARLMRRKRMICMDYVYHWTPEKIYLNWYPKEKGVRIQWQYMYVPTLKRFAEKEVPLRITPFEICKADESD